MIPSTQFSGDSKNISLHLEVDEGAESVDDDSSNDSYHDPASEEEDDIKQEPESVDFTPQNGDSTYQMGENVFPLSTSEWTNSGGGRLSQAIPVVKQEPTDHGEYENSVTQSVETTETKSVSYHHSHFASSVAKFHTVVSDPNVGDVKQELTDKCEYEISVTKSEVTSERTVSHHHAPLLSSGAPTSLSMVSSNIVTSSGAPDSLSVMPLNIVTSSGAPALQSVMSTNNISSINPSVFQGISTTETAALNPLKTGPQSVLNPLGTAPQPVFSIIPGVSVVRTPFPAVQNPSVIGSQSILNPLGTAPQPVFSIIPGVSVAQTPWIEAQTLLPVIPGLAQTTNLATSRNVVLPKVLNVIRKGNLLDLESASASPSTTTPNLQNPAFMFAHPVGIDVQSDSILPPTIPVAANVSNVDQGGSVVLQLMLVPVSGVEWSSRGQQVSTSSENPRVLDPITIALTSSQSPSVLDLVTTAVKQETLSTNTPTGSYIRGADDKQTDEDHKQMDEKMFDQNEKLEAHMWTHTDEEPYKCDVCGKEFNWIKNLQKHMRIHIEKPYRCDVCGKAFNHTGHFKIHMRTHSGDKPYKCDVCGKAFISNGHLKRHMRIHTGDKPYKCDVCGKAFTRNRYLQRHMRTHTGDKPYKCDVCGKAFSEMGSLQSHKRVHT